MAPNPHRERILRHAWDVFLHRGFNRVTVDDLASGLGISKKTFYQAFESKDELVSLIVHHVTDDAHARIEEVLNSACPFLEKLQRLMNVMGTVASRIGTPFATDMQRCKPELWRYVQEFRRKRIASVLARLLEEGKREGLIRADLNHRVFLLSYLGAVDGVMQPALLAQESFSAREALDSIMHLFFTGAMTRAAAARFEKEKITSHND